MTPHRDDRGARDGRSVRDARDETDAQRERENEAAVPWDRGHSRDGRWRGPRPIALLWLGMLAAPAAFMVELTASFALVERVCETGGVALIWAVTIGAALVAVAAGVVAWRNWQAIGPDPEPRGEGVERSAPASTGHTLASEYRTDAPGPIGRSRFMALAGIGVSAFFLLVVLASAIPMLALAPCH